MDNTSCNGCKKRWINSFVWRLQSHTLNRCLKVDRYPIPRVDGLMAICTSKFCIFDLGQAYQQLHWMMNHGN